VSLIPTWYAAYLALALAIGRGFDASVSMIRRLGAWLKLPRLPVAAPASAAVLLSLSVVEDWPQMDRGGDRIARAYGEDLLLTPPSRATVFVEGDNETFLLAYLQQVDGLRPDVRVLNRKGYIFGDPFGLRGLDRAELERRRHTCEKGLVMHEPLVYFTSLPSWVAGEAFAVRREGLLWRVASAKEAAANTEPHLSWPWNRYHDEVWAADPVRLDYLTRKCLVSYPQALAETAGHFQIEEIARAAWKQAARIGFDFPEAAGIAALLAGGSGKDELP
jgi:hypothetical protein